ncbi:UNVERIFIED_CONTAM: hypothetical protein FKN15_040089, partial [Acipenser sinensis]
KKKLYCWNCLLFSIEKAIWNSAGYSNLGCLSKSAQKHEHSQSHLRTTVTLKTFGKTQIDVKLDEQKRRDAIHHNEQVRKNCEVLKRLTDSVVYLGKQELAFREHNEGTNSSNRGKYVELLPLISDYDSMLSNHLSIATVFSGTSNKIQNE